jgi:hypothetical protein
MFLLATSNSCCLSVTRGHLPVPALCWVGILNRAFAAGSLRAAGVSRQCLGHPLVPTGGVCELILVICEIPNGLPGVCRGRPHGAFASVPAWRWIGLPKFLNDASVPFSMLRFWGNFRKRLLASCGVGRGESRGGVGHGAGVVLGNTLDLGCGRLRVTADVTAACREHLKIYYWLPAAWAAGGHAVAWATVPALCWVVLLTWIAGVCGFPRA